MSDEETDLAIAAGGPAGMMAGLMFARAGVRTIAVPFIREARARTARE